MEDLSQYLKCIMEHRLDAGLLKNLASCRGSNGFALRSFQKGEIIIEGQTSVTKISISLAGACRIILSSKDGTEIIVDMMPPPQMYGLAELFAEQEVYRGTVIAAEPCTILEIGSGTLMLQLERHPELYCTLAKYLAIHIVREMDILLNSTLITRSESFALYLLNAAGRHPFPYTVAVERTTMAAQLHMNLRTLYRYIERFRMEGFLTVSNRKIVITRENYALLQSRYGIETCK